MAKRKTKKKIYGGNNVEFKNIMISLLDMETITFLPNSDIIITKNYDDYMNSVDAKTLLELIQKMNLTEISPIKELYGGPYNENNNLIVNQTNEFQNNINIVQPEINNIKDNKYHQEFLNLKKQMDDIDNKLSRLKQQINVDNYKLQNFQCIKGLENTSSEFLSNYLLECSNNVIKNVNWYNVILNQDILDDEFNVEVNKFLTNNDIRLNEEKIKLDLELLKNNDKLKDIFKKKIL